MKLISRALPKYSFFIFPVLFQLSIVTLLYFLNKVYGNLYDAIQQYNGYEIWYNIIKFSILALFLVFCGGYGSFFNNKLVLSMRCKLYEYLSLSIKKTVDIQQAQKLQEDIHRVCDVSVELGSAILKALIKLPLFAYVIASLTQWWVAMIIIFLVVMGTLATKIMAKGLVRTQSNKETMEARFRADLMIKSPLNKVPDYVKSAFLDWNRELKSLLFLQNGLGQMFALLPFILLMPLYLTKSITLGAFFQSVNGLSKVVDSLSVLIDNRALISNLYTSLERLNNLKDRETI